MSSAETSKNLLQPVPSGEDTESLLKEIELGKVNLTIRLEPAPHTYIKLKAKGITGTTLLTTLVLGEPFEGVKKGLISFDLGFEKYVTQTSITRVDNEYFVSLNQPIFTILRQQTFRVSISRDLNCFATLSKQTDLKVENLPVDDLSMTNCSFELPIENLKDFPEGTTVDLVIKYPSRPDFTATAEIKHIRPIPKNKTHKRVGCEFKYLKVREEDLISSLVLEIHRLTFQRHK